MHRTRIISASDQLMITKAKKIQHSKKAREDKRAKRKVADAKSEEEQEEVQEEEESTVSYARRFVDVSASEASDEEDSPAQTQRHNPAPLPPSYSSSSSLASAFTSSSPIQKSSSSSTSSATLSPTSRTSKTTGNLPGGASLSPAIVDQTQSSDEPPRKRRRRQDRIALPLQEQLIDDFKDTHAALSHKVNALEDEESHVRYMTLPFDSTTIRTTENFKFGHCTVNASIGTSSDGAMFVTLSEVSEIPEALSKKILQNAAGRLTPLTMKQCLESMNVTISVDMLKPITKATFFTLQSDQSPVVVTINERCGRLIGLRFKL